MPRIAGSTPDWLLRPSPGFGLFSRQAPNGPKNAGDGSAGPSEKQREAPRGPKQVLARRGTEVFVAVANTIRWSDLAVLKDEWQQNEDLHQRKSGETKASSATDILANASFKILKAPIYEPIQRLIPSPNGVYMAIATSHTIHIAILPDSSHLDQPDTGPLRLKAFTLGPTCHVLSQAPLASVLWHPLGVRGNSLVTITADAVLRIWEIDQDNRWSFDVPTRALDLRKLQQARSADDDIEPDQMGINKGFSLNAVGMEVAGATFGSSGAGESSAWSSMTLWIAMTEGDVYAICPLLPHEWQPTTAQVGNLLSEAVAKQEQYADAPVSGTEIEIAAAQIEWLKHLDTQDPVLLTPDDDFSPPKAIYRSPSSEKTSKTPFIPRLRGPFRILPGDIEDELDLADIHIIPASASANLAEDVDESIRFHDDERSSNSIVCLLSRHGRVLLCLNLEDIEGQWLPRRKRLAGSALPDDDQLELLVFDALETMPTRDPNRTEEWPSFTADVYSRHSFFVTHSEGIFYFSLSPLLEALRDELGPDSAPGATIRLEALFKGSHTLRERLLRFPRGSNDRPVQPSAPVVWQDSDLGYFLLSCSEDGPYGVQFESINESELDLEPPLMIETADPDPVESLVESRQVYQPPRLFYDPLTFSQFRQEQIHPRHKSLLSDQIRLSSATLEIMTSAHRSLSTDTHRLGVGVSDLFSRCARLQVELANQISRTREIVTKIEHLAGEDSDQWAEVRGRARIEQRLHHAEVRRTEIAKRHDQLRHRLAQFRSQPLSLNEQAWAAEVDRLDHAVDKESSHDETADQPRQPWQRYEEAKDLAQDLVRQSQAVTGTEPGPKSQDTDAQAEIQSPLRHSGTKNKTGRSSPVPALVRRMKVEQVMDLLDRESALVDATQARLQQLTIST